jgi:hypothetical protein
VIIKRLDILDSMSHELLWGGLDRGDGDTSVMRLCDWMWNLAVEPGDGDDVWFEVTS